MQLLREAFSLRCAWRFLLRKKNPLVLPKIVLHNTKMKAPTDETYTALQQAYEFFNLELYDNELPNCLITLQRRKRACGYFSPRKFRHIRQGVTTDEIAMNPAYFLEHETIEILQTLVHEMAHLWQAHRGKPSRGGYHNKQWAAKMENVGLMPSSTGGEGGKKTGQSMSDYPIPGGPFMAAYNKLMLTGFSIPWGDMPEDDAGGSSGGNRSNRFKYTCPGCGSNIWGKPGLNVVCGDCMQHFECDEQNI